MRVWCVWVSDCVRIVSVSLVDSVVAKKVVSLAVGHSSSGRIVPPLHYLFYFFTLGDTIREEPLQRAVDSNNLRLPPPTFAQHDSQTRGPPKVVKSDDRRLGQDFRTSHNCSTFSSDSHKSQLNYHFSPIPMDVVVSLQFCHFLVLSLYFLVLSLYFLVFLLIYSSLLIHLIFL